MDVAAFCRQSRVVIVAGKGGVGKTTMTAALAHLAAQAGLSVLVVELEGRPGVASAFGHSVPLDYAGAVLKAAARPRSGTPTGIRPRPSHRARSGPGPSPPTTRCSSTWPTTACGGCPSG